MTIMVDNKVKISYNGYCSKLVKGSVLNQLSKAT